MQGSYLVALDFLFNSYLFLLCPAQVAVLVELKARFDEVRNMGFAQKLEVSCSDPGGPNVF